VKNVAGVLLIIGICIGLAIGQSRTAAQDNTVHFEGLLLAPPWVPGVPANNTGGFPVPVNVQACLQIACAGASLNKPNQTVKIQTESGRTFQIESVAANLDTVWDMVWAPDGEMWITERGGRISRVDVRTGRVTVVGQIPVSESREAGLLGIALHPDFPKEPWVYVVGTFKGKNRLLRARYENEKLGPSQTLLDGIPGNTYHNGSRLVFGPDRFLYMSMGEAGSDSKAQDLKSLSGKILRLTAEGKPAPGNPFNNEIWSVGHRNPQGLAFQPGTGALYSSEHGADSDDEVNLIERGHNYGWPKVRGACDSDNERGFCREKNVSEPVAAFTPSVAPSGIDFYDHALIPGWKGSLLVAVLGRTSLLRITLTPDGRSTSSIEQLFHYQFGRIRDVLVGPDGIVYVATSNRDGHFTGLGLFEGDDKILRIMPLR